MLLSNTEVLLSLWFLIQSISEASSHHEVMLCVQKVKKMKTVHSFKDSFYFP